ncbi:hypothetical protein ACFSCZ_12540 [Siminovitchia sediminis]|uniref:Uncharacterized protein n=1 Tax=Siminovitchia sediminis TaxID=1274353 RepID=A0ABW4KHD1_9BACI
MDKATKTKFTIVFIIGVVLLWIIITNQFGRKESPEFDGSFTNTVFPDDSLISQTGQETTHQETEQAEEKDSETIEEEPDFESEYASKFGDEAVEKGKEAAEKVVTLWLEEDTDKTKWKPYSSSSFFNAIKKELLPSGDGVSRKVAELDIHAASRESQNEMRFGVVATWDVVHDDSNIGKQTQLFYVSVVPYKKSWVVHKIVEPSEENHSSSKQ